MTATERPGERARRIHETVNGIDGRRPDAVVVHRRQHVLKILSVHGTDPCIGIMHCMEVTFHFHLLFVPPPP